MKPALYASFGAVAVAIAIVLRLNASKLPAAYEVEHRAPKGWAREQGTPSTIFLYRHPESRSLISGSLSHSPEGVAAPTGTEKAQSMASTPLRMQVVGEVRASGVVFGIVSRGGWDLESLTAFGSMGRTTLAVTLSGPNGAVVRQHRADFETLLEGVRFVRRGSQ